MLTQGLRIRCGAAHRPETLAMSAFGVAIPVLLLKAVRQTAMAAGCQSRNGSDGIFGGSRLESRLVNT